VRALRAWRAAAVAGAVLALVGCGKRGNPVPPQVRAPRAVSDLRAVTRHDSIELSWSLPRRRIDGKPLFDPGVAKLYRTEDSGSGEPRAAMLVKDRIAGYTEVARFPLSEAAAAERREAHMVYTDRRDLTFGRRYTYVVITSDARGHVSAPSARTSVTFIAAPEPPGGVRAEAGDAQVRLEWQPPAHLVDGSPVTDQLVYEISRAPDATAAPTVVGRTPPGETSFVDRGATNDLTYQYTVRAIRTEGAATGPSAASAPVTATPAKRTPPAPPIDLAAIASRGEVRLSWKPSPAPDVAAYVIYRAAPDGTFIRVGSARPPATTFVDRDVPPGRHRYAVTAQDTSLRANESARSNEVMVTVP
jgi:fibronectin type 3 domain-containing protein